jgi:hypothetical protein
VVTVVIFVTNFTIVAMVAVVVFVPRLSAFLW